MTSLATASKLRDFAELAKPRIVGMVLLTAATGFFLARRGALSADALLALAVMLGGTGAAAAGAAVLNNYLERETDARMERTRYRPIPAGRIEPSAALMVGVLLVLGGVAHLALAVNLLSGFLALLTAFLYVLVYTPLKKVTWLNTSVGAIPGAIPPMIGWAAATDRLDSGAWLLFAILYLWQHPHFFAIAWMYRDDYRAAGFKMLSVVDPSGRRLFRQAVFFSACLIPASVALAAGGWTGSVYLFGSVLLGAALLTTCLHFAQHRQTSDARRVLWTSVVFLPLLLGLIAVDVASRP